MKPFLNHRLLATGLFIAAPLIFSSTALSQTKVAEVKDWSLWETSLNGKDTCTLQAVEKMFLRSEDFYLEIVKQKNSLNSPVEVYMRIQKNKKESTALVAQIANTNKTISFSDLTGTKETYWGTAKNLSALINQLKSQQDVTGKARGGKKEIDFTIRSRGFSDMMSEMEKRCNNSTALVRKDFEDEFFAKISDTIDGTLLNPAKTTSLRNIYFLAYQIHSQLLETKSQLNQVLAKYQKFVDELANNKSELNQITTKDLPQSQKTLADSQKLQADMKLEIARLTQLIPTLNAKVQASQIAFDKATAVLAPLVPQFNRLSNGVQSAQLNLNQSQSRLVSIENRLQEISRTMSDLQSESNNIQNNLPRMMADLDRAKTQLRDAEIQRSNFNTSWERDRALRANSEYNSLNSERATLDQQMTSEQVRLQQIQAERNRAARDLEVCGSGAGVGGGTGGLVPPLVPGVIPPTEPTPLEPPSVDCSALEQGLAHADQMLANQKSVVENLNARRQQVSSRVQQIENQVQSEINRIAQQLSQNEQNAREQARRIELDVNQNQNRLWSIRNNDLPKLSNEQNQLLSDRSQTQSQIAQSTQTLDQMTRELSRFRQTNNWDQKAADVNSKQSQLTTDQNILAEAKRSKANSESRLADGIDTEVKMKKRIADLNQRVAALNARNVELDGILKTLPSERAPFDQKIVSLQKDLDVKKSEYQSGF